MNHLLLQKAADQIATGADKVSAQVGGDGMLGAAATVEVIFECGKRLIPCVRHTSNGFKNPLPYSLMGPAVVPHIHAMPMAKLMWHVSPGRTSPDIDSHIKKLRKKLTAVDSRQELIHSVYGAGYKFEAG